MAYCQYDMKVLIPQIFLPSHEKTQRKSILQQRSLLFFHHNDIVLGICIF